VVGSADFTEILRVLQSHEVDFIVVGGVNAVLNGAATDAKAAGREKS
jgi:hypothetical protein